MPSLSLYTYTYSYTASVPDIIFQFITLKQLNEKMGFQLTFMDRIMINILKYLWIQMRMGMAYICGLWVWNDYGWIFRFAFLLVVIKGSN